MKLICIGRNYAAHAAELNNKVPKKPLIFMKPASALASSSQIPYPDFTNDLHYELEVLLFISKEAKNVSLEDAPNYYDHIGLGIDFTARDVQQKCKEKGHPWERAKSFDNSAIIGQRMDKEKFDLENLKFSLLLNDKEVQSGNTKDLIFDFNVLIQEVSKYFTLNVGDIIFTGTPAGVGPVKPGDRLQASLEEELYLNLTIIQ
ncbi:MAG: fumarylacetoacetate hydrolase family protein [Saprospiraceae bacterium]|nr:fumarylacetoacetate hydrolase family protein [Saprospiraceae bacterium]